MTESIDEETIGVATEYWFFDHYRVLVINRDTESFVSVDVYRRKWPLKGYDDEICVAENKYCIVYKKIDMDIEGLGIAHVIIVGVKIHENIETVNVRWILGRPVTYELAEKIFYESWRLIGCKGPRDDPWITNCPDTG